MAVYEYTAKDDSGNKFSGTYSDITDVATLRYELGKLGYVLVKARRAKNRGARRKKVKQRDVVAFAYKFAGMYSAGLSVLNCLETLEEQAENIAFKNILSDVRQSIERGSSLKSAFEKHRNIFSDFFLGMIDAGEAGGKLATALEMSAMYLENRSELKQKVRSAFTYPIVVGIVCFIVVICLLIFVVPMFSKLYQRLHVSLPGPTQFLVSLSYMLRDFWWGIIILVVAGIVVKRWLRNNLEIKTKWDIFKLKMPIFGKLNRMIVVSYFTRTFALLVSVGVSLIEALEVSSQVVNNHKMTEIVKELQASIKAGNPVAKSMGAFDIFPPMIVQLAASGEEAGVLADMLNKGAEFLDKDINRVINALLIKLEPILTLILGSLVGLILMGVYLPMFDYMRYLE
jgi:type IV pilus assembly protein PilC